MKRQMTTILILALALAFALSSVALAVQKAAPAAKPELKTAQGKVTAVDAKAKSLTVTVAGAPMTFYWYKGTKIMESGHKVKHTALVAGSEVTVKYHEKAGKNMANEIVIAPAAKQK